MAVRTEIAFMALITSSRVAAELFFMIDRPTELMRALELMAVRAEIL